MISNEPFSLSVDYIPVDCPTSADDWHFFQAFCSISLVLFSISRLNGDTNLITLKVGLSHLENLKSSMAKT